MKKVHSLHIPVMGTAFSIDTPLKVARYGISSVISLVDDTLIEEMREYYSNLNNEEFKAITKYEDDFRAKRITAYLDMVDCIVKNQFTDLKASVFEPNTEITKYFDLLSDESPLKDLYKKMLEEKDTTAKEQMQSSLRDQMQPGSIDVNIMTKLDRANFASDRTPLSEEYSDALSALRGYASSTLNSALILSAGINRRLYTYIEKFKDFYADASGHIKKKIILKVSDYRSSIIQGKFLAKKGLWVSEYRIESGLNCGGHAFATEGFLMGPIMEEFLQKNEELKTSIHKICNVALTKKELPIFDNPHKLLITAQGGIGTYNENEFLLKHFKLEGTGWATPFLLCPEATNVDEQTLEKLAKAQEKDLYLSGVSPLGVPFNNLRHTASDDERDRKINLDKPGSACPKGHLVSNLEFTEKPICTASRQYQKLKIEELDALNLTKNAYKQRYFNITKKSCICHDLSSAVIIKNDIMKQNTKYFSAICPGPNMAYFSRKVSLSEMVGHIYGRCNLVDATNRPNMFIKELKIYVEYFIDEVKSVASEPTELQIKRLIAFKNNMFDGMDYYKDLFPKMVEETQEYRNIALDQLAQYKAMLENFVAENKNIFPKSIPLAIV